MSFPSVPEILSELALAKAAIPAELKPQPEIVSLIDRAISEEPPVLLNAGGFIAPGYDGELDDLRMIATEGSRYLAEFQAREQERTGIRNLKVKHVSTFGYVIEIPKGSVAMAPADYERRQTLTTGERFTTPELKEYEQKVVGAQEKSFALEQELFKGIVAQAKENAALCGLSEAPIRYIVDDCKKFIKREITRGRKYDAIIMDPPSYGRGPNGEVWRFEDSIGEFVELCAQVLSDNPLFIIINSYTAGISPSVPAYILGTAVCKKFGGRVEASELGLTCRSTGLMLPCGSTGRWTP